MSSTAIYLNTQTIATQAYIYGYASLTYWVLMSINVNDPAKAPFNALWYANQTSTPTYSPYSGPNTDTVYCIGWGDLTNTGLLLTTPNTLYLDTWLTVQILSIYTETLGNWPGLNKNQPSKTYLIVGPNWDDANTIYYDVDGIIRCPTNIIYIVGRVEVKSNDLTNALNILHGITIEETNPGASVLSISPLNSTIYRSLDAFTQIMNIMKYNPPPIEEKVLIDQFVIIGLNPAIGFNPSTLTSTQITAFNDSITAALQIIPFGSIWSAGAITVNNWTGPTKLGTYGDNYVRRAASAFGGPAANFPQEQYYVTTTIDSTSAPINCSAHNYNIHFNSSNYPIVNPHWGFASITIYTATVQLYPNSINRYAVGSNTGTLVFNSDGTLDIPIQNSAPDSSISGYQNWLPCPPGSTRLIYRMYSASQNQIFHPTNVPAVILVS